MTNHRSELELETLPKLQHKAFLGIVEDERGRVVTTENDRYIQGQYCRLGKVLFCYEDKVLISGFDKKPHMVLADMAAM